MKRVTIDSIDALLPQTQCGECGYPGCRPYAEAIITRNETIQHCKPGGVTTLRALAALLDTDADHYIEEVQANERPPALAAIRTEECIGCTKCIQACPVDAIIGAPKQLHLILKDECTGCGLCIPPCPVDCIDLMTLDKPHYQPQQAKMRYLARTTRLQRQERSKNKKLEPNPNVDDKTNYIAAALERVKQRKHLLKGTDENGSEKN